MQHENGFLTLVEMVRENINETDVFAVKKMLDNADDIILIDVREESEWVAGHIPGAIHLSKGIIERDIEKKIPDKSKALVLYCGGGFRSALAADNIQKMGYTHVLSMDGGMRAWLEAEYPIVDAAPS